jgi:hypothetical protein
MRVKLGLSEREVMQSPWISLQLQMNDFPYYDPKAEKTVTGAAADKHLEKYMKK